MERKFLHFTFKTIICFAFYCCVLCLGFFVSCKNEISTGDKSVDKLFEENPVTISWTSEESSSIDSYSADVSIYEMNNRKGNEAQLKNKYRMSFKNINNRIYNRIDFDSEFANGTSIAALSDGTETIVFDPVSSTVLQRTKETSSGSTDFDSLGLETAVSRVNLSRIRSIAQRLSFDITEDSTNGRTIMDLPSSFFPASDFQKRISTKVTFDSCEDVLQEVETVDIQNDGTKVTVQSIPIYEECNGEPVKIGSYTIVNTDSTVQVPNYDSSEEWFESPDDVPEISDEEYEELKKNDLVEEIDDMSFGDPSSLSSVQTIVEVYNDVEINNVSDELFKLIVEE